MNRLKNAHASFSKQVRRLNDSVANSVVGRYFKIKERKTTFTREIRAGCTAFLTVAYIIAVNANIISDTFGPCDGSDDACRATLKKDLITATATAGCIGSILMGVTANLPFVLGAGMGMNAYFTYQVVGYGGSGAISYETALAAVCMEGIIFLILALSGVRRFIALLIPKCVRTATVGGIGLFIAFIGLQASNGLGIVVGNYETLVGLGGCPPENYARDDQGNITKPLVCVTGIMTSPTMWIGILGFFIICLLMHRKKSYAVVAGMIVVTALAWFRDTTFTYFPDTTEGNDRFSYFKQVVNFHTIQETGAVMDFNLGNGDVWVALITFLYVDLLDTTGTLFSMAKFANLTDKHGNFEGQYFAFCVDAVATIVGSLMGISPVTTMAESAAGIAAGGRTGITAITCGLWFFIALFFNPIFASIPPYATGPVLIITGSLMMKSLAEVKWNDMSQAIPVFVTVIAMPLTYSIAYGLIGGICTFIILNGLNFIMDIISDWSKNGFRCSGWKIRNPPNQWFKAEKFQWQLPWKEEVGEIVGN
eukprot:Pgem_evm1s13793